MRVHMVPLTPSAMQGMQCIASQLGMRSSIYHNNTLILPFLISCPQSCEHLHLTCRGGCWDGHPWMFMLPSGVQTGQLPRMFIAFAPYAAAPPLQPRNRYPSAPTLQLATPTLRPLRRSHYTGKQAAVLQYLLGTPWSPP